MQRRTLKCESGISCPLKVLPELANAIKCYACNTIGGATSEARCCFHAKCFACCTTCFSGQIFQQATRDSTMDAAGEKETENPRPVLDKRLLEKSCSIKLWNSMGFVNRTKFNFNLVRLAILIGYVVLVWDDFQPCIFLY